MTLRELAIAVGFKVNKSTESQVERSIQGIKNTASALLGAIGVGLSISGITNLAEAAADVRALESQFTQVFGEMESDAAEKLDAIADNTGILTNRIKGSFTQIAAFAKTTGMEQADALNLSERALNAVADSAAFYDRTIEQTTENLQSFLKGNFENDAALGLSCTETTRNAAANALYGKSFKDLSESQKQLTLLQMVEDANKASGALGQAARESDTWTNQMGNLKQSVQDLKAAAGESFLDPAVQVLKGLISLVQRGTRELNRLKPTIERVIKGVADAARKASSTLVDMADKFGGVRNVVKLLTVVVAAFIAVSAFGKVVTGVTALAKAWQATGKAMLTAKLHTLAIVAVVALIFLVIDDFINFMKGNDSVIGEVFKKMGVDTEEVRDTIKNAWNTVVNFLKTAWTVIKQVAMTVWGGISSFFNEHGEQIKNILTTAWGIIQQVLSTVFDIICSVAMTIFNALQEFWAVWGDNIMAQFEIIGAFLGDMAEAWMQIFQGVLDFLTAVFQGDWEGAWNAIQETFTGVWEGIKATGEFIWSSIENFFGDAIENIKEAVFGWYDAIMEKVEGAANFIKDLLGMGGSVDVAVNAATAKAAASGHGGSGRTISQTNSIYNTFNGGTAFQQKTAAAAMNKSGIDLTKTLRQSMANS